MLSLSRALRPRSGTPWVCARCATNLKPSALRASSTSSTPATPLPTEEPQAHSTAPKPSINLKFIRENVEYYTKNCKDRHWYSLEHVPARIANLYDEWIAIQRSIRNTRGEHNALSGRLRSASPLKVGNEGGEVAETRESLVREARKLKEEIAKVSVEEKRIEEEMKTLAAMLPNTTHTAVPLNEPRLISYLNPHLAPPKDAEKDAKSHTQIGAEMGLLDFSAAAQVSGWGWYFLMNDAVLLEQALVNYALNEARARGFKLASPPSMVYSSIASACGFRPRDQNGEQQIYQIAQPDNQKGRPTHVMAGTAEIPLAGMKANSLVTEEELPEKVVGVSRCYRAEAGARGAESKGLYRVHEFTKVELFAWAPPPSSPDEPPTVANALFDELLSLQSHILSSLKLHCRVLEMPASDLGASAHRKVDIEAFIPSRSYLPSQGWGEVSSLSNCTDYQSRRLGTKTRRASGKTGWAWTLNGTAMAVPRVLMAILENGYVETGEKGVGGRVRIPAVLRPYMGGREWIEGTKGSAK